MDAKKLVSGLLFTCVTAVTSMVSAQSAPALNDPELVTTVMQFTAKDKASIPELKKRMAAIRDFQKAKSKVIESVLMQNVNGDQSPQFVGVAKWKTIKDWEAMWTSPDFQSLVSDVTQVGTLNPGVFAATK
ncbi:MAG: hypothetical protein WA888_17110 [Burkholderiaceae bacterium]